MKNQQTPRIILYQSHDIIIQNNRQYCVVTDKGGATHKISDKRQPLWGLFINARDAEPFLIIYETYNNVEYVAAAQPITDELLKLAIQDTALKLADRQTEERIRSQSIAYAKDLVCAGRVDTPDSMFDMATKIYNFIKGVESKNGVV